MFWNEMYRLAWNAFSALASKKAYLRRPPQVPAWDSGVYRSVKSKLWKDHSDVFG